MRRRSHARLMACVLFCCVPAILSAGTLAAQDDPQQIQQPNQPAKPNQLAVVHGLVRNGASGEPLPRALVRINGDASTGVLTDGQGRFEINDVPEGPQEFTVIKPGFIDQAEAGDANAGGSHEYGHNIIVVAQMGDVAFGMVPVNSIRGQIQLSTGDVAQGITVSLLRRTVQDGRAVWQSQANARTNSEGVLTTRANRLRNVFRLGGRHHEDDVRRRLLQRLQQRIEGSLSDLVRFIKDINLVAVASRRVAGRIAQFANLIDSAIGGRVNLDHVDGIALADFHAGVANTARFRRRPLRRSNFSPAIKSLGQDAGNRGFADAAVAREDVAMGNAVLRKRIQQRPRDVVLPGDVGKLLGPIFPCQNLVTHPINNSLGPVILLRAPGAIVSFQAAACRGGKSGS